MERLQQQRLKKQSLKTLMNCVEKLKADVQSKPVNSKTAFTLLSSKKVLYAT